MIVSSDPDYSDTKLVKQGRKQLEPAFQELADWISEEFGTKPLNIYYDKIEIDKNRPRLNIIFEYYDSVPKFRDKIGNYDSAKQKMIADKFRQILVSEVGTNGNYFSRLFKKVEPPTYDTDRLLVIFDAFEPIAREEVNGKIPKATIENLKHELKSKNIWEIYPEFASTTYFFHTDQQIEDAKTNGTTEVMKKQYFDLLKKYDEFDYFKPDTYFLTFDSKENFDKTYQGNWFYYSRR
jgi:hypothetical protein